MHPPLFKRLDAVARFVALAVLLTLFSAGVFAQATKGFATYLNYTYGWHGYVGHVVTLPDGKFLVSGQFSEVNGIKRYGIARLNPDGSLDPTFTAEATNAVAPPATDPNRTFAVQPDGKIIVNLVTTLSRVNANGSVVDPTFNGPVFAHPPSAAVSVTQIVVAQDGKIYVVGNFDTVNGVTRRDLVRLNSDGSVDTTFADVKPLDINYLGTDNGRIYGITPLPDGKLLATGRYQTIGGTPRTGMVRLNTDGTVDESFSASAPNGGVVLQPDGKLLINGSGGPARFFADGTWDTSFNPPTVQAARYSCAPQGDKYVCVGGQMSFDPATYGPIRLNADGSRDMTFHNSAGMAGGGIWVLPDGKILRSGDTNSPMTLALFNADGTPDMPRLGRFDFDGDLSAEVSVFRPSEGRWYIKHPTSGYTTMNWGEAADKLVAADYDGDTRADMAVYRESDGTWYIHRSLDNTFETNRWGMPGDKPLAADYDGDRKADFMIYRPSEARWYFKSSIDNAHTTVTQFGQVGDTPLVADWDHDFRADLAVYRPSINKWIIHYSVDPPEHAGFQYTFGEAGDLPFPADYNGDGFADLAVYNPTTGLWKISGSRDFSEVTQMIWGVPGDKPVPSDFDADGTVDRAVFRPSDSTWYIVGSSSGFYSIPFGASGDVPAVTSGP